MTEANEGGGDEQGQAAPGAGDSAQEEEMRRAMEEELRNAHVGDMVVQSAVGIINLTARRIAVPEERDLEQARLGIDVSRSLVDHLPEEVASQIRDALSQLQMQYASIAGEQGGSGGQPGQPSQGGGQEPGPSAPGAAPGESSGGQQQRRGPGLWTPPGSA